MNISKSSKFYNLFHNFPYDYFNSSFSCSDVEWLPITVCANMDVQACVHTCTEGCHRNIFSLPLGYSVPSSSELQVLREVCALWLQAGTLWLEKVAKEETTQAFCAHLQRDREKAVYSVSCLAGWGSALNLSMNVCPSMMVTKWELQEVLCDIPNIFTFAVDLIIYPPRVEMPLSNF